MKKIITKVIQHYAPSQVRALALSAMDGMTDADLARLGFSADTEHAGVRMAMDAAPVTSPNAGSLIQFFQYWMPEAFEVLTTKRNADALWGRDIMGSWEDEEVVVRTIERLGTVHPYSDVTDVPLVSWNQTTEARSNARFEAGMMSGKLADLRAARMFVNPDAERRAAIAQVFAINQNTIAFGGYADGETNVYGGLNDPNLLPYISESGANPFVQSTFAEITARINLWMTELVNQSGQNVNPYTDAGVFAVAPTAHGAMMTVMNPLGTQSVIDWFKATYKGFEVVPCIELAGANGGDDVAYIKTEKVGAKQTAFQAITAEMRLLGVEPRLKGTLEGYTASTAGVIVAQPIGIVRATGV